MWPFDLHSKLREKTIECDFYHNKCICLNKEIVEWKKYEAKMKKLDSDYERENDNLYKAKNEAQDKLAAANAKITSMVSAFDDFFKAFQHSLGGEHPVFLKKKD